MNLRRYPSVSCASSQTRGRRPLAQAVFVLAIVLASGCQPAPKKVEPPRILSNRQLVAVSPIAPLRFAQGLGFEILDRVQGQACVRRGSAVRYWTQIAGTAGETGDDVVDQAIAAAMMAAIDTIAEADTVLLTRVQTDSKGGRACARVWGRGIRLAYSDGRLPSAHERQGEEREPAEPAPVPAAPPTPPPTPVPAAPVSPPPVAFSLPWHCVHGTKAVAWSTCAPTATQCEDLRVAATAAGEAAATCTVQPRAWCYDSTRAADGLPETTCHRSPELCNAAAKTLKLPANACFRQ